MKLAVAIATLGRPEVLARTLAYLAKQSRLPDEVVVSATCDGDVGALAALPFSVKVLAGPKGSCAQRNTAIDHVRHTADIIAFFDDDFLPGERYLADLLDAFQVQPGWTVITGQVVADGVTGAGLSFDAAEATLGAYKSPEIQDRRVTELAGAYGCNMAMRVRDIGHQRFDERLVLYGWQEDTDFTARVAQGGKIVRLNWLPGVHLGVKGGRTTGVRFGYSQIANPLYLVGKGTVGAGFAANLMVRNLIANLVKSIKPEPWVDRRGRLKGNVMALADAVRGRASPERVLSL